MTSEFVKFEFVKFVFAIRLVTECDERHEFGSLPGSPSFRLLLALS